MFSYHQLDRLKNELVDRLIGFKVVHVRSFSNYRFCLDMEKEKSKERVFFSFEKEGMRFHLSQSPFKEMSHSHPLEEGLQGKILKSASLLNKDKILRLEFDGNPPKILIGEFFSRHPNCYLLDETEKVLFSLYPLKKPSYSVPKRKSEWIDTSLANTFSSYEIEALCIQNEKTQLLLKKKEAARKQILSEDKKIDKKIQKLEESLEEARRWEEVYHLGELIKANLFRIDKKSSSIDVWDFQKDKTVSLEIDSTQSPQDYMKECYKKSGKLKRSQIHLEYQIERLRTRKKENLQALTALESLFSLSEIESFCELQAPKKEAKKQLEEKDIKKYRTFSSSSGLKILVGKDAKGNEELTFQIAKGNDLWLHFKGGSGSHVVVQKDKHKEIDEDSLKEALQIALYYSKGRQSQEGEVCYTLRKYVRRAGKGQIGKVFISQEKSKWIRLDRNLVDTILSESKLK